MTQKGGSFRVDRDTKKFWQERKRQMLAGNRSRLGPSGWNSSHRVTIALIAIETVGWILESFFPGLVLHLSESLGRIALIVLATIMPGSLLGLIFAAFFIWIVGSQLEIVARPWQYLLVFFGSGIVGSTVMTIMGGLGGALAAFGLAGAYVYAMSRYNYGAAVQWALFLLLINVLLSGFQPAILLGMAGSFGTGLGLAWTTGIGERR
ncbi:hypothetical protein SAMN00768000_1953 [Sulfobacillus thermosulfidooxidans DSM 9293]|uniref:Rhomboid family intramembrane serine protease n=1 Tax=Sulfobacillus thermosulfidooxidans (strain DSM 9293 / VKM B-1269 / AT-1) TaxID=929705 RepID=A0A1W1WFK4_SULTA|nr:hypothetical protein [Sulfobacillus thermosulfidooxidans]SMC04982.1 hypothetical protein SAMN00768000_1953 [Sulfobacillus thermosulfidooxidans DSM 9293]